MLYNSALFPPSCCSPFLLHVAASLVCIFLVSRRLVLLSARRKFLRTFCRQKKKKSWGGGVNPAVLKNLNPIDTSRFSYFFLRFQISFPYKRMEESQCTACSVPEIFCTKVGLKALFRIPSIGKISLVFVEFFFNFHRKFHN